MKLMRYDRIAFKAKITKEGYLEDTPIIARTGIQIYKKADGTIMRELRLPEHVFAEDSLASYAGKPITDDHPPEPVNAANYKKYSKGTISGPAFPDGKDLRAHVIVQDGETIEKAIKEGKIELSAGYTVVLDETPGFWEGQEYDAIQTKIDVNHLSVVKRGRAGNARLNLDSDDAVSINEDEEIIMSETLSRLRLDSGLEYQAAPEVIQAYENLRKDISEAGKKLDNLTAERDTLKSQIESADKVRSDALEKARAEVKARSNLDKVAETFKIDGDGKTDREVKELVIKSVRADADLANKSDDYINAAFDFSVSLKKDAAMAEQRQAGFQRNDGLDKKSESGSYKSFMSQLSNKEQK